MADKVPVFANPDGPEIADIVAPPFLDLPLFLEDGKVEFRPHMLTDAFNTAVLNPNPGEEARMVITMQYGSGGLYHMLSPKMVRKLADAFVSAANAMESGDIQSLVGNAQEVEVVEGEDDGTES